MADGAPPAVFAPVDSHAGGAVLFALQGSRYALPLAAVDAVMAPPALCRVPHAPAPLLGAGNLGGQVLPVIDLAEMLRGGGGRRCYDGGGAVLRVRAAGGSVGVWVDRVERFVAPGPTSDGAASDGAASDGAASDAAVALIDPEPLIRMGMTAPELAPTPRHPLAEAAELLARPAAAGAEAGYFLVVAAGEGVRLARDLVIEFLEAPPWVAVPGAPAGFIGVGIVSGEAYPILSLAFLLGLKEDDRESARPGCCAIVALPDNRRLLLGFERIIGLRTQPGQTGRHRVDQTAEAVAGTAKDGRAFDLATALPVELRRIVSGFAPLAEAGGQPDTAAARNAAQYLAFVVGDQRYALPVAAVDRVIAARQPIALPGFPGGTGMIAGAIDLRGQLVPVATLEAAGPGSAAPSAYVILRGAAGPMAIGAQRVERLITLQPEQIVPPPGGEGLFDGVAVLDEGSELVRILAPDRVGVAG